MLYYTNEAPYVSVVFLLTSCIIWKKKVLFVSAMVLISL